jgi:hypothetical protein
MTLVEMLVSLVLGAIVVSIALRALGGWSAATRYQLERSEAQQTLGVAAELIAAELRAVPPQGLLVAAADSVVFRNVRTWGVVCGPIPDGFAMVLPGHPEVPAARVLASGIDSVAAQPLAGAGWVVRNAERWTAQSAMQAATAVCAARAPAGAAGTWTVQAFRSVDATGLPAYGRAYLFETVKYTHRLNHGQRWIYRSFGSVSNPQPFAGPIDSLGLAFEFFDEQELPAASPDDAGWVRIRIVTQSRYPRGRTARQDTVVTAVSFRNRP